MQVSVKLIEKLIQLTRSSYPFPIAYMKDCDNLSIAIKDKTNHFISATTLKRIFGFTKSSTNPSEYTLNALSEFVGFNNWNDFEKQKGSTKTIEKSNWEELKESADVVSNYTLDVLKSNSGFDASILLYREHTKSVFKNFIVSNYTAMAIIADGGMGKSTMLMQAVDYNWLGEKAIYKNDIVWFISGSNLRGLFSKQFDLESWFMDMFSLSKEINYREYFYKNEKERKGNIYLIIDALDELVIRSEELESLYRKILELIASSKKYNFFKVILSIRSATWQRLLAVSSEYEGVEKQFYNVSFNSIDEEYSNIPLLNDDEICLIIEKYFAKNKLASSKPVFNEIQPTIKELIKQPYLLQIYLQSVSSNQKLICSEVELLEEFIKFRVYKGKNGFEKNELFNAILASSKYGKEVSNIKRQKVESIILKYKKPYKELVSYGILKEYKALNKYKGYVGFVKFGHEKLFEYLIAKKLIELNDGKLNFEFLSKISVDYTGNEKKLDILKYICLLAIEAKEVEQLAKVFDLSLNNEELNHLAHALGLVIRNKDEVRSIIIPLWLQSKNGQTYFMERFVDLDNLNGYYGEYLVEYLKKKKTTEAQIFGYSLLCLKAFHNKDKKELNANYDQLAKIKGWEKIHPFPLGRYFASKIFVQSNFGAEKLSNALKKEIELISAKYVKKADFVTGFEFGFHFHILEALFLTGNYEYLITFYTKYDLSNKVVNNSQSGWFGKLSQLYCEYALFQLKRKNNIHKILPEISSEILFRGAFWYKGYFDAQIKTIKSNL